MKKKLRTINYQLSPISYLLSALLLLSTIGYLSAVALAKADQLSTPSSASADQPSRKATAGQEATADRSAQLAPTWKPRERGALEKYDNPPMYIFRLETSPRMISQHGPFVSHQVNVDAS